MAPRAPGPVTPADAAPAPRGDAVRPFPRPAQGAGTASPGPLAERIARAAAARRAPAPYVIPAEIVTALVVELPRAAARQRAALLTFAVEERLGAPIDAVAVAPARLGDPAAPPGAQLAFVVSRAALAVAAAQAPAGAPILPDLLAIPRPEGTPGAPVWSVWRDGARAVVRRSDGTGFAVATDALASLWVRGGRPTLLSLGAALPSGLPATDLSAAPPEPDADDLLFSFRASRGPAAGGAARPLAVAAAIAGLALAAHLALAAADAVALGRIAVAERATAAAALAPVLPSVAVDADPSAILARLAPAVPVAVRSDFLPLLTEASDAIARAGSPVTLRRLAWGAEDGTLALLVQGRSLDDLQAVEAALREAGLGVTSGAASAGDGGAEVEMRVGRGASG